MSVLELYALREKIAQGASVDGNADWQHWLNEQARDKQKPPNGDWRYWLILAGRGFGKTRTVAEWARMKAVTMPNSRGAIVAATAADTRDVVAEGDSGIMNLTYSGQRPEYMPSKRRITFPNGSIITTYSADEPNRLRGPQHHWAIADEIAAWRRPESWDQLMFGLRLGDNPQCAIATTPRPTALIKQLVADENTVMVTGSTYENKDNLALPFLEQIVSRYEGTQLGRQELYAEILDEIEGALWKQSLIDQLRVNDHPQLTRIVVGVDPAASSGQTGIVVAGVDSAGTGYILDDVTSSGNPDEWANATIAAYNKYDADRVIAEKNNGGKMVADVLRTRDRNLPIKLVHAAKGKIARAEPIAALYEQERVHHMGMFAELEQQMTSYVAGEKSPDRLDAMVWALTELMITGAKRSAVRTKLRVKR